MDIASLTLAVDTTQLEKLAKHADAAATSSETLGKAVTVSNGQMGQFSTTLEKGATEYYNQTTAALKLAQATGEVTAATSRYADEGQKLLDKQRQQLDMAGKTAAAYGQLKANSLGVGDQYRAMAEQIEAATAANSKHGLSMSSNIAKMEVLRVVHDAAIGSYTRMGSAMLVLGNASGASALLFSALGLAMLAPIGALVALGVAMYQGAEEQKSLRNSLTLTGNFAGITGDSFNAMAATIATATDSRLGPAKAALAGLVATGQFSGQALISVGDAAVKMSENTGEAVGDVVKDFARMADGVLKWADAHDKTYNFLTVAQRRYIEDLEKQGRTEEAMAATGEMLDAHLSKTREILGFLPWLWKETGDNAASAWQKMMHMGGDASVGDQIIKVQADLAKANKEATAPVAYGGDSAIKKIARDAAIADAVRLNAELLALTKQGETDQANAKAKGASAKMQQELKDADREMTILHKSLMSRQALGEEEIKAYEKTQDTYLMAGDKRADNDATRLKTEADIREKYAQKGVDTTDKENAAALASQLHAIDNELSAAKAKYSALDRMDALYHQFSKQSDDTFFANKAASAQALEQAEIGGYDKKITLLSEFNNKDLATEIATQGKIDGLYAKKLAAEQHYQDEKNRYEIEGQLRAEKVQIDSDSAMDKYISKLAQEADRMESANRARGTSAATIQRETMALNDQAIAKLRINMADQIAHGVAAGDIAQTERAIAFLTEQNVQLGRQAAAIGVLNGMKLDDKMWKDAAAAAKDMSSALTDAFGTAGEALGKMGESMVSFGKKQHDLAEQKKKDDTDAAGDTKKLGELQVKYDKDSAASSMKTYGEMAGAAQGFFEQGSKGYEVMGSISKAFHLVETAMAIESMVSNATTNAAKTASNVATIPASMAAGGAQMFAQSGWGGFIGIAAMVAVIAALGFAASGGGAAAPDPASAAQMQKTQGTGTVFGDSTAKSDSIDKAMSDLKNNSDITLPLTQQMAASLRNIESGIGGLANLVLRTKGVSDGSNLGIATGSNPTAGAAAFAASMNAIPGNGGGFMGKINAAVGNLLFGGTKTKITDGGIQIGGTVGGLQTGTGVDQYANVQTKTSGPLGGIFGGNSTSNKIVTQALPSEYTDQFSKIFTGLGAVLSSAATALGKNGVDVGKAVQDFVLTTTRISLSGLSGADQQTAIMNVLSASMDTVSEAMFPELGAFRQVGEGYVQTVVRVATGIESGKAALDHFGIAAINFQDIINKQGDVGAELMRQSIVNVETAKGGVMTGVGKIISTLGGAVSDLTTVYQSMLDIRKLMGDVKANGQDLNVSMLQGAGGSSQLNSGLSTYLDKYFSPSEKVNAETKDLKASFDALGLALPTSREEFRKIVQGIDTTTDAGSKLFGQLMALASPFSTMIDDTASLTGSAGSATGAMTALVAQLDQIAAFKASLASSIQTVAQGAPGYDMGAHLASNQASSQAAFNAISSDTSSSSLNARIAAGTKLQGDIMASYDFQKSALDAQSQAEQAAYAASVAAQNQAIAAANQLAASFKGIGDYAKGLLTGPLSSLTGAQKSAAIQADYSTNLAGAQANNPSSIAALQASAQALLTDKMASSGSMQQYAFAFQKVQTDLATLGQRGDVTLQSVVSGGFTMSAGLQQKYLDLEAKASADLKAIQAQTDVWQIAVQKSLDTQALSFANLGLTADAMLLQLTGLDVRVGSAVANAVASLTGAKTPIPGHAAGGYHPGGWAVFGENGPELAYTGAASVVSNGQSQSLMDTSGMIAELRALRVAVAALKDAADKSAKSNATVEKIFQRVTNGGTSIQTVAGS